MRMTMEDFIEMIERNETPEQYEKRIKRIKRLSNEYYDLEDAISVLVDHMEDEEDRINCEKKVKRLAKVTAMLDELC